MSRLGKQPVTVPSGVTATADASSVKIKGPKGELTFPLQPGIAVKTEGDEIVITRDSDQRQTKAFHGLTRAVVANMVVGVTEGYKKSLEVQGVGYNAQLAGKKLTLAVGFANKIDKPIPDGLNVTVDGGTTIHVEGIDKQKVGAFAAEVRAIRKPEPYKGKGVRYLGEQVKIKPGKATGK